METLAELASLFIKEYESIDCDKFYSGEQVRDIIGRLRRSCDKIYQKNKLKIGNNMKKVEIIDNEVVFTFLNQKYILDKKEYRMSHIEAVKKLGDKITNLSQLLFLQDNIEEINESLLKVGGEPIKYDKTYWCREQYSALDAWHVYMRHGYIHADPRASVLGVRAVSPL